MLIAGGKTEIHNRNCDNIYFEYLTIQCLLLLHFLAALRLVVAGMVAATVTRLEDIQSDV